MVVNLCMVVNNVYLEGIYGEPAQPEDFYLSSQVRKREYYDGKFQAEVYIDLINKRLVVVGYKGNNWEEAARGLKYIAQKHGLGKILFNVRASDGPGLEEYDFVVEGIFPRYFREEEAVCYSCFTDPLRGQSSYWEKEEEILNTVLQIKPELPGVLPSGYVLRSVRENEAKKLVGLYSEIFTSYPSPVMEVDYVRQVMASHVCYWGVFKEERLISAASAEINDRRAEVTDCATLPAFRGKGLLTHLLQALEEEMRGRKLDVLFSLARAGSFGMNAVLHRMDYSYCGRFINNCHIGGRYEDMNLWVKELLPSS